MEVEDGKLSLTSNLGPSADSISHSFSLESSSKSFGKLTKAKEAEVGKVLSESFGAINFSASEEVRKLFSRSNGEAGLFALSCWGPDSKELLGASNETELGAEVGLGGDKERSDLPTSCIIAFDTTRSRGRKVYISLRNIFKQSKKETTSETKKN